MVRLLETYAILNANCPSAWSPDALIDAMQTGDRMTYHYHTIFAFENLRGLGPNLRRFPVRLALDATKNAPAFALSGTDSNANDSKQRLAAYNSVIDTAMSHIADISETQPRSSIDNARQQSKVKGP